MKSAQETIDTLVKKHDAGEKADRLSLYGRDLTVIPDAVWNLTWIKTLTLDFNPVTKIDERIGNLTQLRSLSAENTKLKTLPKALATLPALRAVSLRYTELHHIPASFTPPNLNELHLDVMELRELPPCLVHVEKLRKLWLWRFFHMKEETVAGFVSAIGELDQLTHAGFFQGELQRLPKDLSGLAGLKHFDMGLSIPAKDLERLKKTLPVGVLHEC